MIATASILPQPTACVAAARQVLSAGCTQLQQLLQRWWNDLQEAPEELANLIEVCMAIDPEERPSSHQIFLALQVPPAALSVSQLLSPSAHI